MAIGNFSTGLSALQVHQRVLELLGQNVANVHTPGYHRREAILAPRFVAENPVGSGVEIADIRRIRDDVLEQTILQFTSEAADFQYRLPRLEEIESLSGTGAQSLRGLLDEFFNQLEQLAVRPADETVRRLVVDAAQRLANRFRDLHDQFRALQQRLFEEAQTTINRVNALAGEIAELNRQIARGVARGITPHDALDRRDQVLGQLAELVGVQVIEQPQEQVNVLAGGVLLVTGEATVPLEVKMDRQNRMQILAQGVTEPLNVASGALAGMLAVRNEVLPEVINRLHQLARAMMSNLDQIHAAGLGLSGEFSFLSGGRAVANVQVPLERAEPAFPVRSGTVWVSITNLNTGERTVHAVSINPQVQTLAQVASAFSTVPHLQALVDAQTGTLQFLAEPGYVFDFAGRIPTQFTTSISGTAQPRVHGTYTGTKNDVYTVTAVNSGTVGLTPNLTLEVRNSAGQLLRTVSVGQGYAPHSAVAFGDGLVLELSAGTIHAGDTFQLPVIAQPDTTGLLTALGLNTLFTGTDASTIQVHAELLASPQRLAVSQSGASADTGRLRQMVAVREQVVFDNGLTLSGFFERLMADLGAQVQATRQTQEHLQAVGQQLRAEQQALSGVDANEELVRLLQYQRAFQLAARYVAVVNETLEELLRLV
ncbi:MAG: flagellar hook-associated protein FlgK [Gemmatales bacterium]|nr:flagellar hook-associated protein FlgK [Gemmatales bacterium]MDW8175327.1 flagellar hook-associated protein FlgK [Gemmatales bacterium]